MGCFGREIIYSNSHKRRGSGGRGDPTGGQGGERKHSAFSHFYHLELYYKSSKAKVEVIPEHKSRPHFVCFRGREISFHNWTTRWVVAATPSSSPCSTRAAACLIRSRQIRQVADGKYFCTLQVCQPERFEVIKSDAARCDVFRPTHIHGLGNIISVEKRQ